MPLNENQPSIPKNNWRQVYIFNQNENKETYIETL